VIVFRTRMLAVSAFVLFIYFMRQGLAIWSSYFSLPNAGITEGCATMSRCGYIYIVPLNCHMSQKQSFLNLAVPYTLQNVLQGKKKIYNIILNLKYFSSWM
jgi:hypothetical protein